MGTQWTLSWPQEPKVSPFLAADYNKPGDFEARRVTVMDGIARVHAGWFRDGFGKGSPDLFVDLVKLVHARGMKILAVFGAAASDYPPGAYLDKAKSGCQWGDLSPEQDQSGLLSETHRSSVRRGPRRRRDRRRLRGRQ
jgi:hypothetical protein